MKLFLLLNFFSCFMISLPQTLAQQYSLRFYGTGPTDIDRVKIPIDNPHRPVDVDADFTIEFWMKANPGDNSANTCDGSQWYYGNIIIDRDIFGDGDYGDYGIALGNRRIMVGVQVGSNATAGVCGNTIVDDGNWHHIAVTRQSSSGGVWLYVDGVLDAYMNTSIHTGNISYRDGRTTSYPNSDPYLVLGAEKHDYPGSLYYKGWLDELRISNVIRYTSSFTPPTSPFSTDANTVGLYHFDEGAGTTASDVSGAAGGPSNGTLMVGGNPPGPQWSTDSPFMVLPVELASWRANVLPSGCIELRWETKSEVHTAFFAVERMLENEFTWKKLSEIPARGAIDKAQHYSFLDDEMGLSGRRYYRLLMQDFDGSIEYSPTITVLQPEATILVFPNPVRNSIYLETQPDAVWQVFLTNAFGEVIKSFSGMGAHEENVEELSEGVYFMVVQHAGTIWTRRLVKM